MDQAALLDLYNNEQLTGDYSQQLQSIIENRIKHIHTAQPGIIKSYDPGTNTAVVQPGIQRIWVNPTESKAIPLPVIPDVPVVFPSGGGFTLTFPVAAGDECLIVFLERSLDYWHRSGGIQLPSNYRMHSLSDAVAFVGLRSQAKKISNISMDGVELRNSDRSLYIKVAAAGIQMKGDVSIDGTLSTTKDVSVTGNVTATVDVKAGTISITDHIHTGVTTGTDNTGPATG